MHRPDFLQGIAGTAAGLESVTVNGKSATLAGVHKDTVIIATTNEKKLGLASLADDPLAPSYIT
jgi:hypothetical protein